jgi:hypothetical protein
MSGLVPLNASMSNIQQFVPSLFGSVRALSNVEKSIEGSKLVHSFADSNSVSMILNAWLAAWQQSQGDTYDSTAYSHCPSTDQQLIAFLAGYIKTNNTLSLCVPSLTRTSSHIKDTDKYVYSTAGYGRMPFFTNNAWNYGVISSSAGTSKGSYAHATVADFLYYLYFGAHFVVPSASSDNGGSTAVGNLYAAVNSTFNAGTGVSQLDWSWDKFNSHYSAAAWVNTSGYYYLSIGSDSEPSTNPLLCAFLVGKTADVNSNTFFQLEGWQNHFPYAGGWHSKDYDSYNATLWNFSTFGACAYSEKRSTPMFLAGPDFSLGLNADTMMPLYVGAGSVQNWMNTDLLTT